jgi:hypothetical protein
VDELKEGIMIYPTINEVNGASHEQICRWYRFLPSPGMAAINMTREVFEKCLAKDVVIMNRITERLEEFGGFTPEISKRIGW